MIVTEEHCLSVIIKEAFSLHTNLGPGMLEKVYSACLAYRLKKMELNVEVEKAIPIEYEEIRLECGYRADLIVEHKVIVEIKSVDYILPVHISQLLTYLRFANLRYGLLLNFNTAHLKDGIRRVLNGYDKGSS